MAQASKVQVIMCQKLHDILAIFCLFVNLLNIPLLMKRVKNNLLDDKGTNEGISTLNCKNEGYICPFLLYTMTIAK